MNLITEPTITLIGLTEFQWGNASNAETDFWPEANEPDSNLIIEFAGRQCYKSWRNPAGRSNEEYIANILQHGHLSVLEHANATFQIKGVSRSLTHELIRHRHLSPSQVSQRYVPHIDANFVIPRPIDQDEELRTIFVESVLASQAAYDKLLVGLELKFAAMPDPTARKKAARQAARSVMPNATETELVMTGNFRAWRWFLKMRCSEHADEEIRQTALVILRKLQDVSPAVFGDFAIGRLPDGSEAATSPFPY